MILPQKTYFLCSTPRSGSTVLCYALQQTGRLGAPDEFFSPDSEDRWGTEPDAVIRRLVAERTGRWLLDRIAAAMATEARGEPARRAGQAAP